MFASLFRRGLNAPTRIFQGFDHVSNSRFSRSKIRSFQVVLPKAKIEAAVAALKGGQLDEPELLYATCPLCQYRLGCRDHRAKGLIWLDGSEHYVQEHGLWVPELDRLIVGEG